MEKSDLIRVNLVKCFKHFEGKPVNQKVFTEYCNREGIKDIGYEQFSDRMRDWQEDKVIAETLPHIFQILAEAGDLHMTDFHLEDKRNEVARNIRSAQAKIAHLLKRADVPYDRHGDIMFMISSLLNAICEQATETNRRDVQIVFEDMAKKEFGREATMMDIAKYNEKLNQ